MIKKRQGQNEDENLFRAAMDGVVPLKTAPRADSGRARAPAPKARRQSPRAPGSSLVAAPADVRAGVGAEDGACHRKDGVQKKLATRLKRGRFELAAQLDLHHMNTATAREALLGFIADARSRAYRCVRVIHGKGLRSDSGPRLKLMALELLRQHPEVLAFTACKPADGGSGATDVLLRQA